MELTEKIQEAIKASLPEKLGAELRGLLVEAEENRVNLLNANTLIENQKAELRSRKLELEGLREKVQKFGDLDARAQEMARREMALENLVLRAELEFLKKSKVDMMDMFRTIFKNPVAKETILRNGNEFSDGCSNTSNSSTTTVVKEVAE